MNNSEQLWQQLSERNWVTGNYDPDSSYEHTPWYIQALQGFAGWIASFFLLGFFAGIFGWFLDEEIMTFIFGIPLCVIAGLVFKAYPNSSFFTQAGLAFSLAGQLLIIWGMFELIADVDEGVFFAIAAMQLLLAILMPNYLHRVLSSWFAIGSFFMGLNVEGIYGLGMATAASLFTLLWQLEKRFLTQTKVLQAISLGVAIALLQLSGHLIFRHELSGMHSYRTFEWQQEIIMISNVLLLLCCLTVVMRILNQLEMTLSSSEGLKWVSFSAALIALSLAVPGATAGMLVLLIGFYSQRRMLQVLGVAGLISFISWYYYSLETTLLVKSIQFISIGAVSLALYLIIWYRKTEPSQRVQLDRSKRQTSLLIILFAVLAAANTGIYQKERLLAEGQMVLLELAPVDPRSLMQGDYMRLNYAIGNQFRRQRPEQSEDGYFIVKLDSNNVASLVRLSDSYEIEGEELVMRYRYRKHRLKFASNAFFFQEGTAKTYEAAKYGEFRVAANGEMLLTHLRDENFNRLKPELEH